jgi:hypothetical protein
MVNGCFFVISKINFLAVLKVGLEKKLILAG